MNALSKTSLPFGKSSDLHFPFPVLGILSYSIKKKNGQGEGKFEKCPPLPS